MHVQVLGSGSEGNALVVRAGDLTLLVDAGLGVRELSERFEKAKVGPCQVDHLLITHGHLDHSRNAGAIAKRQRATLHCAEKIMRHPSLLRAPRHVALRMGHDHVLEPERGAGSLIYRPVLLPHDCDPTVAFRLQHGDRVAVVLTDIGRPDERVAHELRGAHLLHLEFNYDPEMLRNGPYPYSLQRRIAGGQGHLSNAQSAQMLKLLAGPELHTLVLAHISKKNNSPELALAAAHGALAEMGRSDVQVLVAEQKDVGQNLAV